jgi:hypothetical protein
MKIPNPFRFLWAMLRTGYAKGRGYRILTNPGEETSRWTHCLTCPYRIPGPELIGDQCAKCGCLLDAKVLLTMEECPVKKWKRIWSKTSTT